MRKLDRLQRFHRFAALALVLAASPLSARAGQPVEGHAKSAGFQERFSSPPAECRILKIIHSWPDDPAAQDALIQTVSTQGFGGVVCNVSFDDYLESDAKWNAFARAVAAARKAGFALWLYDEKGYPSATAGGLVLKENPEWQARGLLISEAEGEGTLTVQVPPGELRLAAAYPMRSGRIDLGGSTNLAASVREGALSWATPEGRWKMLVIIESALFEGTHASMSLSRHIPYPNLLDPAPVRAFLEVTHQRYAAHLGDDLGRYFISTFTDEPSLMSLFLKPMPYRPLPWSPNFPGEFKKRRGYTIEPLLPALIADAGPAGARARYDYWETIGELVSESYFGQIQDWCAGHQLLSGGHLLMEENLLNQVPLYGDFFRCLQRLSAPGIDCLTSIPQQVPWQIARLAGSAADLQQRPVTMCETSDHSQRYRPPGDQRPAQRVSEAEIRGTCNRLIVNGIDTITSYYSFDGLATEQLRRLNEWIGRCCVALRGGCQVADIAVVYPTESVWPRFTPARHYANDSAAAARIESICQDVSDSLFTAGRDFTYIDGRAIAGARVEAEALVHGGLRWRVIVLPGADTLPQAAWDRLAEFVRGGGVLISVGALPANNQSEFPAASVQALAKELFGADDAQPRAQANRHGGAGIFLPAGCASLLPAVLDQLLEPDMKTSAAGSPLHYTHRRIDGHEIYFVINDRNEPWSGTIGLSAAGPGEQCDPATGLVTSQSSANDIELKLPAFGGMVFRFSQPLSPARHSITTGALPSLTLRELPAVTPVIARGEYVRENCAPDPAHATVKQPAWRISATLTKSQVDTYLFVRFPYLEAVDLSNAAGLVLDTWVPEDQRTPARLLVILHEKSGADYLATTSRLLGASGPDRTFLPLSRFQLAGWSKDANGKLDLNDISEVRVGWGGYFGFQGEQIQFTLCRPRLTALAPSLP